MINFGLGVIAMVGVFLLRGPLGIMLDAPEMGRFIPGFAVAVLLDNARTVPSALLVRDLRFRAVSIVNSLGELTFTGTAVALAPRFGWICHHGGGNRPLGYHVHPVCGDRASC